MESLVTIVVPSYRGAPRLVPLADRLLPVVQRLRGDLVFVDDASDDGTWPTMLALARRSALVRCVRMARRGGQQLATLAGCSVAAGRWVVTMDDDLEHDPSAVPRLLERAGRGYDLVYAVPHSRPPRLLRRAGSRLFDVAFSLLVGKPWGLRLTSFRVLDIALVRRMLCDRVPAVYVSALALRQRPRVTSVRIAPGPHTPSRTSVRRLAATFARTIAAYSAFGRLLPARPALDFLRIAEVRGGLR